MTSSRYVASGINIPFVALAALLVLAVAGLISLAISQPSSAKRYEPHAMSVRDDRCYSAAANLHQVSGLFGQSGQGLTNAIMNAPIYDWDQGDQMTERTAAYTAYNIMPLVSFVTAGLRGPQKGMVLDYADKFDFTVQMLPSVPWMVNYIGRQLPVDIENLAYTAAAQQQVPGGFVLPQKSKLSPSGHQGDPFVANPFIYMQGAVLDKNGLPKSPLAVNAIEGVQDIISGDGSISSVLGLDSIGNLATTVSNITNFQNKQLLDSAGLIGGLTQTGGGVLSMATSLGQQAARLDVEGLVDNIKNGGSSGQILQGLGEMRSGVREIETRTEELAGAVAALPGISHASALGYSVDGGTRTDEEDLCYEDVSGSKTIVSSLEQAFSGGQRVEGVPQVPAYAFSMLGNPFAGLGPLGDLSVVPMPGIIYTMYMMLDPSVWVTNILEALGVKDPRSAHFTSTSGFDFVPSGSINGKDMLDCFGKGLTRTMWMHDKARLGNFDLAGGLLNGNFVELLAYAADSAMNLGLYRGVYRGLSAGDIMANAAIATSIRLAGTAAEGAGASGAGTQAANIALQLPAIWMAFEEYYSFVPLFKIKPESVKLPARFKDRAIAFVDDKSLAGEDPSKTTDINIGAFLLTWSPDTAKTLANAQFNPDVYIRLKEPYVLKPKIDVGVDERELQDGTELNIDISAMKHGFAKGSTAAPVAGDKYREDTTRAGGPTYDDTKHGDGHSFTGARVYEIVMKPGVSPNAIDAFRVQGDTKTHYNFPDVSSSTDPCEFFANKLRVGDGGALSSSRSTDGSNANNSIPDTPVIENKPLDTEGAAFTCGMIASEEVRMKAPEREKSLLPENLERKIPAETPPGTKYCYAVYFDKYTNDLKTQGEDWWDGTQYNHSSYSTPADTTFLSRAHCVISGYRPSMQVRGGDFMVDGGIHTGTNTKDWLAGEANAEGKKPKRTYGSWAEYGVFASGSIKDIASGGVYRIGLLPGIEDFGSLTFSNKRDAGKPAYGEYEAKVDDGFADVSRQFTSMSGQAKVLSSPIKIDTLESGVYKVADNSSVTVELADADKNKELDKNKPIIILVGAGATVDIVDNIRTPTRYSSTADISQVVFAPASNSAYRLNINSTATQVDAWMINPLGIINTCKIAGLASNDPLNKPRAFNGPCHNELTINGPVSAGQILLRRSGGKDQDLEGTRVSQSIPAETFSLRPDAYLWAASYVNSAGKKYITTNAIDLPPRY